jgi:hypothetical protein
MCDSKLLLDVSAPSNSLPAVGGWLGEPSSFYPHHPTFGPYLAYAFKLCSRIKDCALVFQLPGAVRCGAQSVGRLPGASADKLGGGDPIGPKQTLSKAVRIVQELM